ncbi:MAG TPA: hypothetical protein VKB68_02825 [Stellaceae bacterium]|nr:hypothetical protein [Stellaceae bacterium]
MKLEIVGAAVVAVILASASGAVAFQFVNPDTNSNGTLNLTDPDQHTQTLSDRYRSGGPGTNAGTLKFGNTTLQFGMTGGSNSNYGPSPAIQEKFLQSPASRTVPSQGW